MIIMVMDLSSGAGRALCISGVSASVGGRGRFGVHPSAGGEEREGKQNVQRNERGYAGAAAAKRPQEGREGHFNRHAV